MKVVGFDTETKLIRPGRIAPPIACLSYQVATPYESQAPWIAEGGEWQAEAAVLVHWTDALPLLREWLTDKDTVIVGHNVPFDLAVVCSEWPELVPLVFQAFDEDRITDTRTRQKIIDIADGCYRGRFVEGGKFIKYDYSLLALARRLAGIPIKKEGFRMFYGPLRDVPLERWVDGAKKLQARATAWLAGGHDVELDEMAASFGDLYKFKTEAKGMIAADPNEVISYPLDDARSTLAVYLAQEGRLDVLDDQFRQARRAWWLYLISAWGLRTNAKGVAALQMQTERMCAEIEAELVAAGLVRKDGSRDTKLAKQRMLEVCGWAWDAGQGAYVPAREARAGAPSLPLRLTDSGGPSLDADACKATEDELLVAYAELTSLKAVLNKDVPALARATVYPVHTNFDMAETGRATSSNPNVQNWRRLPGIRECFVPRPGRVFIQADYSGLELATLAQACIDLLGESRLANAINAGLDPHTELASKILRISPEEGRRLRKAKDHEFDNARQSAKVANFGFPGGLGAAKLVLFARKSYGVVMTEADAKRLKDDWLAQWSEMRDYFAHVNSLPKDEHGTYTLEQLRSRRIRGGATYTAACNSYFQGLGADATGAAGWLIAKACYVDRKSPLFGARIVNYVHDEFIGEVEADRAHEAAEELSRLMVLGASAWIPDVKLQAEPCLMAVWSKDAKTIRDAAGRLQPWSPEEKQAA